MLLDQYIAAFENAGAAALERLLVEDVVLEALGTSFGSPGLLAAFGFPPSPEVQ